MLKFLLFVLHHLPAHLLCQFLNFKEHTVDVLHVLVQPFQLVFKYRMFLCSIWAALNLLILLPFNLQLLTVHVLGVADGTPMSEGVVSACLLVTWM